VASKVGVVVVLELDGCKALDRSWSVTVISPCGMTIYGDMELGSDVLLYAA